MAILAGYQISEKLYESHNSLVYRGLRQSDGIPVVLKVLQGAYPAPERIARFRREYEMTRQLTLPGIVAAYGLENDQDRWLMVLEDFGADSLDRLGLAGKMALPDFLKLSIKITDILGQIHQQYIIHKDMNPSNIVLDPSTGQVKVIDFGISTKLSRENTTFRNPNILEGTLPYLAPEQTGRMNRAIYYRTDFYALGVTFYELLTGRLPFPAKDTLEVVHCHIARQPDPPHALKPDIPPLLSEIVLKLMAKNAEDRYQSAHGLKTDLEKCWQQWHEIGRLDDAFSLAQHDVSDQFELPQKLYGREAEIERLLAAFERVSQGASEVVLVSGYAGIGKSTLVQEVYKPLTGRRGYFVAGKCDQLQRNIPYAPLIQAFQSLMQQVCAESETEIAAWRRELLTALETNGQVMIEVIPDVALIIGPQPDVPVLAPAAAQSRFNQLFQNFLNVFARREHPLIVFLDDLQWADAASLQLLELLLTAGASDSLLLIGAYRDNEVSAAHPLRLTLAELEKARVPNSHIQLTPLALPYVEQLTADTLRQTSEQVSPLAELLFAKTDGNPFFLNEFLKSLYAEALLTFTYDQGRWQWDLDQIRAQAITENVVALMAEQVKKLPPATQTVLKLAACIGNRFDLETLAIISEQLPSETAVNLWEAIAAGLVLPMSEIYKLVELDVPGLAEAVTVEYKFAHDRIQQAVYSLIPEADKQATHWRIGQRLLRNMPAAEQGPRLFDIVNQLNRGYSLAGSQRERDELAQLNLQAGRKAKDSVAYQAGFNYLRLGLDLLGEDTWQRQYDLSLRLHEEAVEVAYLCGNFEILAGLWDIVVQQSKAILDQVKVYEVQIQTYMAQNRLSDAIQTALQVLETLGVSFPNRPSPEEMVTAINEPLEALRVNSVNHLIDLPEIVQRLIDLPKMTDPAKLAAMRILDTIFAPSFLARPDLLPLIASKQANLSIEYGNAIESIYGYTHYGLVLCAALEDFDTGYEFGRLAKRLLKEWNAPRLTAYTVGMLGSYVDHWKEHLRDTLPGLQEAYKIGLENSNHAGTAQCSISYTVASYLGGRELATIEPEIAQRVQVMTELKQGPHLNWHKIYWQAVLNWLGKSDDPCRLIGFGYDEEKELSLHREVKDEGAIFNVYFNKMILCYRFQEFQQALKLVNSEELSVGGAAGSLFSPVVNLYQSLTRLALYSGSTEAEQGEILQNVAANQAKMAIWAQHAPMNYLHKFYLVEAERARVLDEYDAARGYYDKAIDLAQKNEYLNEEALAYELAARFYLANGQIRLARYYMRDAHYAYQRWGAVAKVRRLEERYPQLLLQTRTALTRAITTTSSTTVEQQASTVLDLASILKAAQTIAGEIVLETLLTKMMKLVIENAGAEKGYLVLEQWEQPSEKTPQWVIEAEGRVEQTEITTLQSIPVEEGNLATTILNYVVRTQKTVVLNDAANEGAFTQDEYIVSCQPKSILCMPLLNQGKVTGLVYLENNLTTGAFTADRIEVLSMLASQAAISLENARLYSNLAISEEKYRSLFENAPIGMFEIDLSQSPPLILAANHQAEVMYGWPAAEFSAISSAQLVPDDASTSLQQMVASVRRGETVTLESINRRRNGALFPVRISARPETKAGASRMIVTVEDITAEKNRQLEVEAIEAERRRIAHEIHDGLAQDLAALRFKATLWHDLVDGNPNQMHNELDQLLGTLNSSLREVRRSIFALRPIDLDELGFFEALRQFTRNFGEQYDLAIELHVVGSEERLPTTLELPLFRIIQESLNNIRKHAKAHSVQIELKLTHPPIINLSIRDDGVGFGPTRLEQAIRGGHIGLHQMNERVRSLDGTVSIHSKEGEGTEITVTLPLAP